MKKFARIFFGLILMVSLSSCNGIEDASSEGVQQPSDSVITSPSNESQSEESSNSTTRIEISIGDVISIAELDDSDIARQFVGILPQTISTIRGRERVYYGPIDGNLDYNTEDIQYIIEDGDFGYWYSGNSIGFFFNTEYDFEAPSGMIIFGKIISDLSVFDNMDRTETVHIRLADE